MATIVSTLYPPLIDTFMPAFQYEGPAPVSFSFSPYNSLEDIKKIHVSLVNQRTNQSAFENNSKALPAGINQILFDNIWIIPFNINGTDVLTVDTVNNICTIEIPRELLKGDKDGFVVDSYYKVQIRLDNSTITPTSTAYLQENRQYFSEWSSVCLIKAIPNIQIGMVDFDSEFDNIQNGNVISKVRTVQPGIVPIVGSVIFSYKEILSTKNAETLQRYRITIVSDDNNEIIDETGDWVYTTNNTDPNRIYWLADITNADPDKLFTVKIEIITKNQFYFSKDYQLKTANFDALSFTPTFEFKKIALDKYESVENKIVTEEDGMVEFTITTTQELPQGFFYVKRATSLDNYKNWELISCTENIGQVNETIIDPTVGSLTTYKYACQYRLKKNNAWTKTYVSQIVYPDFYDMLIYRQGKQIALRYNTQITSYSAVVNRQVINTLGSKYPKFAENAQMNYKKFTISGLITSESDFNRKFLNDRDFASEMNDYDRFMDGKYEVRNDTIADDVFTYNHNIVENEYTQEATKHLLTTRHDLAPKDNWWFERLFREEALSWLNDGEPKLLRSMSEGNLVVMLTDISLTPNTQIGRRTYNISMTAYEVGDGYSLDVLSSLGIINVPDDYSEYINAGSGSSSEEEGGEDSDGAIEEKIISQIYKKSGTNDVLIFDNVDLIEKPSVELYTLDNYYNGLFYRGAYSNYKVIAGTYRLRDLRIQFISTPQWYDVNSKELMTSTSNINNLIYGYKVGLKIYIESKKLENEVVIFVEEKGYYQVPGNLEITDVILYDNAIATLDFKLNYKRQYDESFVPNASEIAQRIVGQLSGKWVKGQTIADEIKNKYEYYRTTTEKKGFNGLLEKQYLDKITAFGFDGTSYTMLGILFENEEQYSQYLVGRTGVYNLMTDFPIEEVVFLGRRMFRKDNEDYNDQKMDNFIFDKSTAGYQATPIDSLRWYSIDSGEVLDVLVVFNDRMSTPERNQIVRNFIGEDSYPYDSINQISNPNINTIYGIYKDNDVVLMLYTSEKKWVQVELVSDGSHTIIGLDKYDKTLYSKKKRFFLEEWEFSLDESVENQSEDLLWYKTFVGQSDKRVAINGTTDISNYIVDINNDIVIPAVDGYLSTNDIKNPEYNTIYGFKNGDSKKYKIYYIDQSWYDVTFLDEENKTLILADVPVYGMVNYRGNIVNIKYE